MIEKLLKNEGKQVQVVISIEDLRTFLKEVQSTPQVSVNTTSTQSSSNESGGYLDRSAAAKMLNVHPITIYRWTKQNILTPTLVNHKYLYPINQLIKIKDENDFQL